METFTLNLPQTEAKLFFSTHDSLVHLDIIDSEDLDNLTSSNEGFQS